MLVYLNGAFVRKEEAKVSVFDHGFLYGDGIYETMRAYQSEFFMLDKHLERLQHSADALSLLLPLPIEKIRAALIESLTVNTLKDAYVRLHISRGPGEIGLDPALCSEPTMVITAKQFKEYPAELFERGVDVAIVATRRNHPLALNPAIKATNFLNNILAKIESLQVGAYEGIMLNWEGLVAEGTISNIFYAKNNVLYTPSLATGILDGVTRGLVLELARKLRFSVKETAVQVQELMNADECFLTNSTMEIMPVTSIDKQAVGNSKSGQITAALQQAYKKEVLACLQTRTS
jgi:branched-chain amino acid aminotransferase